MSLDALRAIFQGNRWDSIFSSRSPEAKIATAWYPSCGFDWGSWLSLRACNVHHPGYKEPELHIFSDYDPVDRSYIGHLVEGFTHHLGGMEFTVTEDFPLEFNYDIARGENLENPKERLIKRAHFYRIRNKEQNTAAQVIFIEGDNLQILKELFLGPPLLPITHLMWTCDGWTEGMSQHFRRPGNFRFIKQLLGSLGTTWVLTEEKYAADPVDYWPPEVGRKWRSIRDEPNLKKGKQVQRWISHNDPAPIFLFSNKPDSTARDKLILKIAREQRKKAKREDWIKAAYDEVARSAGE